MLYVFIACAISGVMCHLCCVVSNILNSIHRAYQNQAGSICPNTHLFLVHLDTFLTKDKIQTLAKRAMNRFLSCVVIAWVLISSLLILKSSAAELSLGHWMEWSRWSNCAEREYCLEGSRERYRDCQLGKRCVGIEAESEMCPSTSCTGRWIIFNNLPFLQFWSSLLEETKTQTVYCLLLKWILCT